MFLIQLDKEVRSVNEINESEITELNIIRYEYLTLYLKQLEEFSVENSAVYILEEVNFVNLD